MATAILNALSFLEADKNPLVKIPTRKELSKLLKNSPLETFCKVFDELNGVRIRRVPCIEAIGRCGIISLNHPILGNIQCFAYRDKTIKEDEYKLVNSGLGNLEVTIDVIRDFNGKPLEGEDDFYQIFLNTGDKVPVEHKEYSCNDCNFYSIADKSNESDICLYDNKPITDQNSCCNKYCNCFKWYEIKGE